MDREQIVGCLLGTAIGDAIGLPYEGVSRDRAARLLGSPKRHRFFFGRGMVSDDTEHSCMVVQSLVSSNFELDRYLRSLAWRFRIWLLCLPAGVGLATLRATIKLWLGYGPTKSGIFSAGNGPAMRAAILGVAIRSDERLRTFVRATSQLTHSDPKAEYGAFAVALAAQVAAESSTINPEQFVAKLQDCLGPNGKELTDLLSMAAASNIRNQTTVEFAESLGLATGVSGYVYHSVPVALHAWFGNSKDFRAAISSVIECGGDTDTTAAIVGGVVGALVGKAGIPHEWLDGLMEWPRTIDWMERLADQLVSVVKGKKSGGIELPLWCTVPRNLFFLFVVLFHGFRRLFPPY